MHKIAGLGKIIFFSVSTNFPAGLGRMNAGYNVESMPVDFI